MIKCTCVQSHIHISLSVEPGIQKLSLEGLKLSLQDIEIKDQLDAQKTLKICHFYHNKHLFFPALSEEHSYAVVSYPMSPLSPYISFLKVEVVMFIEKKNHYLDMILIKITPSPKTLPKFFNFF